MISPELDPTNNIDAVNGDEQLSRQVFPLRPSASSAPLR
jgi:hypothetical protein